MEYFAFFSVFQLRRSKSTSFTLVFIAIVLIAFEKQASELYSKVQKFVGTSELIGQYIITQLSNSRSGH
jgi:hypothetical protein